MEMPLFLEVPDFPPALKRWDSDISVNDGKDGNNTFFCQYLKCDVSTRLIRVQKRPKHAGFADLLHVPQKDALNCYKAPEDYFLLSNDDEVRRYSLLVYSWLLNAGHGVSTLYSSLIHFI
jgi:hypothetical protein